VTDFGPLDDCPGCLLPQDDLHRVGCPRREELLAQHEVETGETPAGLGYARCACGQWEAVVTGPASARWAFADYSVHLRRVFGTDPGA
jgi:hypothetical protein